MPDRIAEICTELQELCELQAQQLEPMTAALSPSQPPVEINQQDWDTYFERREIIQDLEKELQNLLKK